MKTLYELYLYDTNQGTILPIQFSFNKTLLEEIAAYLNSLPYNWGDKYCVKEIPAGVSYFEVKAPCNLKFL